MANTDDGEIRHFQGTISKITVDGQQVLSDHLMPGEKLYGARSEDGTDAALTGGQEPLDEEQVEGPSATRRLEDAGQQRAEDQQSEQQSDQQQSDQQQSE